MLILLTILLLAIFILPLISEKVESNLEIFLLIMGFLCVIVSKTLTIDLIIHIFENKFLYIIAFTVLIGGLLFNYFRNSVIKFFDILLNKVSIKIIVFTLIVVLGLLSSVITAIIAALLLVEFIHFLPLKRKNKIIINIIACYSIGLGAALTPIGEPLSTIIVSKLNVGFMYIFNLIGIYIIPIIIILGILGAFFAVVDTDKDDSSENIINEEESNKDIVIRAVKVFIFIFALELLGQGFKPIIDEYVLTLDGKILYWVNMLSAVLDNATLASAEISPQMSALQIKAILMGLLISGGMMIPGNIPNIISANKLKIKSKEWIRFGVPLGFIILFIIFIVLFFL
ncbi:Predicted cation transporter [Clostridium cavendishii DSM 21758]|uniref:Predicted cation transporter n=1 Tax=Clostridium cavendishii DSM 21758 TaxID=1121302 RepID=A0A1M6EIP3_9CLOT|nr:DUF1646 family protein [Clostridium cavendishii]SHI85303.1 Predicted cation transporter [Clostridium cavendishii DSM 21758]